MSRTKTDAGPIFVRELSSDSPRSGIASLNPSDISVTLHSFDEMVKIDAEKTAAFVTEDGEVLTLHNYFDTFPGYSQGAGGIVYHEYLRGNTAIVGPETWHEDDLLKRCTFSVEGIDDQLHNNPRFEALLRKSSDEKASTEVLSLQIEDATISVYYTMSSNWIFNRAPELRPRFELEFPEGNKLFDASDIIYSIVEFLSASQSRALVANDIKIYRSTQTEMKANLNDVGDFPYHYFVYNFEQEPAASIEYQFFAKSFAYLRENRDMELFRACLKQWLTRSEDWREASALMVAGFKLSKEMSGARLLAATRWVERIPGNQAAGDMLDEHFAEIVRAAAAKAEEIGHKGLEGRIKGSLRSLKSETNRQRLERLVARGMTVVDPLTFEAGHW
ncbi:hypothetical protein QTN93_15065 [Sphingomonas aerolata]|uniref:hypothetical protein n=1 Tax=Sphingomonas aerolata TaxID=185951 RepID=UPI0035A6B15B